MALVDAALESQLDLATATEHAMAANATLEKVLDPAAEPSWREAAHDVRLRYGVVSLAEGRFDAAVQAFEQTRLTVPKNVSEQLLTGLDRLIALAESRRRLTPEELASGDARAVSAVTLGGIYNLLGWYERAQGFFMMVISGPTRSGSAAHRAYARLGLARALAPLAGADPVKLAHVAATYESGIKEHPQGTWHDETLRELALLLEYAAAVQFAPAATKKEGDETPPAAVSDAERQQRSKSLRAARARALPHWAALPARHPASLHAPQALYHAGILYTEAERPAEAVAAFEQLVTAHPKSPWAGDAHVRLIDVKLERQFDLPAAAHHAQAAVVWYRTVAGSVGLSTALDQTSSAPQIDRPPWAADTPDGSREPSAPGRTEGSGVPGSDGTTERACYFGDGTARALPSLRETGYAIYLRAGLVAYLTERPEEAAGFFEQAKPLEPERGFVVVHGEIPTGMERLLALARGNRQLTPEIVRQGDPKAKLILMLADVYHEAEQWQQSLDLCSRVIDNAAPKATREQRSYAFYRRGRDYFRYLAEDRDRDGDCESAIRDYVAAVRAGPNAPWADRAMFLTGNLVWNHRSDADSAVLIWRNLIRTYPDSQEAHRSAYYIAVVYQWTDRQQQAHQAYRELIDQFPNSPFVKLARSCLEQMDESTQQ